MPPTRYRAFAFFKSYPHSEYPGDASRITYPEWDALGLAQRDRDFVKQSQNPDDCGIEKRQGGKWILMLGQ